MIPYIEAVVLVPCQVKLQSLNLQSFQVIMVDIKIKDRLAQFHKKEMFLPSQAPLAYELDLVPAWKYLKNKLLT